jgi:hypothetical protein
MQTLREGRSTPWGMVSLFVCAGVWAGCNISSQEPPVILQLPAADNQAGPSFNLAGCPRYPQSTEMDRVCMIDSNGKLYREDGTLSVFPAAPPYGVYYQFKPGFAPLAQDVDSTSDTPSIGTFAAPYDVQSQTCCAEDSLNNRIPSYAALTAQGGLLVSITEAVPIGQQIAVTLSYGELFKGRVNPCTLPDPSFCQWVSRSGFAVRFYVGATPSGTAPPMPDAGAPPAGACLLEYNSALAAGDACCYHQGGTNTCNPSIKCNDASGSGCCLIYGTDNTAGGGRCCLYESGDLGDNPDECRTLLAQSR